MIDAFETGKDVHSLTGALLSGKTPEEVRAEHKAEVMAPIGSGNKTWRYWGKKSNHGLNYDLGPHNFSLVNEIPVRDGVLLHKKYHDAYPEIKSRFHGYIKQCLLTNRTLTNLLGRKVVFMGNLTTPQERDKIFKEAYSYIPQGSVGDIINERGLNYVYYDSYFEPVELQMQVHDSIKFQIPLSTGWDYISSVLLKIKKKLETPLKTYYGREFVIPADIKMGLNYGDMTELKSNQLNPKALAEVHSQLK